MSGEPHPRSGRARLRGPVPAEAVLDLLGDGSSRRRLRGDVIVPLANGEPVTVLDAIEAAGGALASVRVHQMHALRERPSLHGRFGDRLRHLSYFLSPVTRPAYHAGTVELVPNHFSDVPALLRRRCPDPVIVCSVSPPDRHGYVSLGTNADYVASFIGRARFFAEANRQMPRTFGRNQLHLSQLEGWCEADYPLVEVPPVLPDDVDLRIGQLVAERVPDGATIQTGIGAIPNAFLAALSDHRNLGVHTELLSDGIIDLVEAGVVNGVSKRNNRTKVIGTFALGTRRLYDFLGDNPAIELWPVNYVNNPAVIGAEPNFVSVNATLAVDLLGQCASETLEGRYWSSSGGQADFARGAAASVGGAGFVVTRSRARHADVSTICATLPPGTVVTTDKNTVGCVVTEHGVAELRGRSISERARALIAIAHPAHRDRLQADAQRLGMI